MSDTSSKYCKICNKTFFSDASFQRHMQRTHGPDKIHDCILCNQSFNEVEQLLDHIQVHEANKSESFYQCTFCEGEKALFDKASALESHVQTHIGSELILRFKKLKECLECGETFDQIVELNAHRRRKHMGKYECDVCDAKFCRSEELHIHVKSHEGRDVMECLCDKIFVSTANLAQHLRNDHANEVHESLVLMLEDEKSFEKSKVVEEWKKYKETFRQKTTKNDEKIENFESNEMQQKYHCPVTGCALIFQKGLTLVVHCRRNHKDLVSESDLNTMKSEWEKIQSFKCSLCQTQMISQENLSQHLILTHHANKPFKCSKCEIRFSKVQILQDHVNFIHKNQQFKCTYCGTVFQKQSSLTQHYKKHEGASIFKCLICDIPYTDLRSLKRHERVHATNGKPHKCNICSQQFVQSCDKIKHLRTHTDSRPYECEICHKRFNHVTSWKRHKAVHTNIRDFVCQHCGKGFQHRSNLIVHLRSHTGERPFQCKECSKTFLTSGHFSDHMKIHLGVKNYKCDICTKEFLHQSSFLKHKKAVHLGIKPFKCKICQREFTQRGHFREHLLIHSDEKKFSCDICQKMFRRADALKSHMNKHEILVDDDNKKQEKKKLNIIKVERFVSMTQYQAIVDSIRSNNAI